MATPSWASLGRLQPLAIERGADVTDASAIVSGGSDGRSLAYCAPGGIHISRDGGATWTIIPTQSAMAASRTTDHPMAATSGPDPACWSFVLDPSHPASYYADFLISDPADVMVPPSSVGYLTSDSGKSWIPEPESDQRGGFGGFALGKGKVQELYGHWDPEQGVKITAVRQSGDGGRTWTTARLAWPEAGPCVRWGPGPSVMPPRRAPYSLIQELEVSADGGNSWRNLDWPSPVWLLDNLAELAPLGPLAILLIDRDNREASPLTLTRDGGQTWQTVTLPALPSGKRENCVFLDLQLLPTGALPARSAHNQPWQLLAPAADHWCPVSTQRLPASAHSFTGANGRLWWIDRRNDRRPAELRNVQLASVDCNKVSSGR